VMEFPFVFLGCFLSSSLPATFCDQVLLRFVLELEAISLLRSHLQHTKML
jgi:hypothetical protein